MKEIWKSIKDYEGLYEVSNKGRVRSLDRYVNYRIKGFLALKKGQLLSPIEDVAVKGYLYKRLNVGLQKNSKKKTSHIHRLVAEAFIPNPNNKPCVNHLDNNPFNNFVENLEWCTLKENSEHAVKFGKKKSTIIENYVSKADYMKQYMEINSSKYFRKYYKYIKKTK